MALGCSPGRHLGQLDLPLIFLNMRAPLSTVLQVSDAQDRHHERSRMFCISTGTSAPELGSAARRAVAVGLRDRLPIPHPLMGPGASSSAKAHVGLLAESIATGAWVAWGAGLAAQACRRRRTSPAHKDQSSQQGSKSHR